jgi:small subunit ribosomal protein S9
MRKQIMNKKTNYLYATGKRKSALARVRLFRGKGENLINGVAAGKYFPGEINRIIWEKPLRVSETLEKYYFSAKISSGGKQAQLDALVHGLARALAKASFGKYRPQLKALGFLTRDARIRQRRMVGMGGKSRRQKQSPKR